MPNLYESLDNSLHAHEKLAMTSLHGGRDVEFLNVCDILLI